MVKVRKAAKTDLPKLIKLRWQLVEAYPDAYLDTLGELKLWTKKEWEDWLDKHISRKNYQLLVAEDDNRLVGLVCCKGVKYERAKHVGTVRSFGILPSHQGQGVAKALLGKLIDWVKNETEITRLQLDAYTDNPRLISFYEKMGFVREGVRKKTARKTDGTYQDMVDMALFL